MTSQQKNNRAAAHAELGTRVIAARESLGLSTAELAQRMGVTNTTMTGWEAGRAQPRTNKLVTLAGVLAVSPTWLLSGLGDGPQDVSSETRIEALGNGITELRHLSSRIAAQVDDLEQRLAVLKKSA